MSRTCYLCNKPLSENETKSLDHVLPKHLKSLTQPKTKGYDYAGTIETHERCNNQFGPETYCIKALKLLTIIYDDNCYVLLQHKKHPSITIQAINSDCLRDFTKKDLTFFKFIDASNTSIEDIASPVFYSDKRKTNVRRDALFTSLSVLTKSTAALIIKRNLISIPRKWKVLAFAYVGADTVDFDKFFGNTKPFDIGVKVWIKKTDTGDMFAAYKAKNLLIFFLFNFSESDKFWNGMIDIFQDTTGLCFEGENLNELIDYQWVKAIKPKTAFTGA